MALSSLLPWRHRESAAPLVSLQDAMNGLFEDLSRNTESDPFRSLERFGQSSWLPRLDVAEDDEEVQITAELPGLAEEDINVTLTGQTLTLRGEKKQERTENKKDVQHTERTYGAFARSVGLPCDVDQEKVAGTFKDGVLTITLPKTEHARRQSRTVPIKGRS